MIKLILKCPWHVHSSLKYFDYHPDFFSPLTLSLIFCYVTWNMFLWENLPFSVTFLVTSMRKRWNLKQAWSEPIPCCALPFVWCWTCWYEISFDVERVDKKFRSIVSNIFPNISVEDWISGIINLPNKQLAKNAGNLELRCALLTDQLKAFIESLNWILLCYFSSFGSFVRWSNGVLA